MNIQIINGPNLNLLESRDPVYGGLSLDRIKQKIESRYQGTQIKFNWFQSNIEGELVTKIQECKLGTDLLIINPGGYSHTSVAIHDALEILNIPKIEVHLSNTLKRESFRHNLLTGRAVDFIMKGFGAEAYALAVEAYLSYSKKEK